MVSEQDRPRTLSEEWRGVRKRALGRDGEKCRNCGVGDVVGRLECHHIVPVSEGGEDVLNNLITLCSRCHRAIHRLGGGPEYQLEILQNPSEYDMLVPSKEEEDILSILKFDRANPRYIMNETGLGKSNVEYCLRRLTDAGWVDRPARGLYEYVEDPRIEMREEALRREVVEAVDELGTESDPADQEEIFDRLIEGEGHSWMAVRDALGEAFGKGEVKKTDEGYYVG